MFYLPVLRLAFLAFRPRFAVFFGTFAPAALASERPIAMACLRLVTFRPERPLFKVPALRSFIARSTLADAFFEYFRAMIVLRLRENNLRSRRWFPFFGFLRRRASAIPRRGLRPGRA